LKGFDEPSRFKGFVPMPKLAKSIANEVITPAHCHQKKLAKSIANEVTTPAHCHQKII